MANVLEKIVADKRLEIAERKESQPLSDILAHVKPTAKSFYGALAAPNASFIFECKKASPSKGLIREHFDLDEILAAYTPYAACISVLTDEKYFQGTFAYLEYVTSRVDQPVINKDFFVDEYQIHLARYYNADAVLLMLSVLDDDEYQQLRTVAESYQMDVLTEVSNVEEMQRAIALKANIIGINNRNLRDLSTDLATTEQLTPLLVDVDFEHVVISESGIYTHADVKRLSPLCDGFLVGSAMMAQADLKRAVKTLLFPPTKVCGVTTVDTALLLADLPTDYVGLIMTEKSKRYVSLADAHTIVGAAPNQYVGVFVDQDNHDIAEIAESLHLSAVQLHGNESLDSIESLRSILPGSCQIWKAVGIPAGAEKANLPNALFDPTDSLWQAVDRVLLDCKVGDSSGGTGQVFDWSLISTMANKNRLVLAGGINPENVVQAQSTGVGLIDINSGVEDAPGKKNSNKLQAVFQQLRAY